MNKQIKEKNEEMNGDSKWNRKKENKREKKMKT